MRRGKKRAFCILALAAGIGLAGCSPIKVINKVWRGEDISKQTQIVYRIASIDPTEEEIEDTAEKLLMRAKSYDSKAQVETRGNNRIDGIDRIVVFFPSKPDLNTEKLSEELTLSHEIQFITENGAVVLDGDDIESAEVQKVKTGQDEDGSGENEEQSREKEYQVELKFTETGTEIFAEVTQANIRKKISIVYDGKTLSSLTVHSAIVNGKAVISNIASKEEAEELAGMINIGSLPLKLEIYEITEETED